MGFCSRCGKETTVVSALFLLVSMSEASLAKEAYACATRPAPVSNNCILFDFDCGGKKRILIRDIFYIFGDDPPDTCRSQIDKCRTDTKGCCQSTTSSSMQPYSTDRKYEIYTLCTWSNSCTRQTFVNNGTLDSKASLIKYECREDAKTAHFCVAQTQKVKTANIIFDGTTLAIHYPVRCVCTVETEDGGPFIMRAPDLRLQSLSKNCSTHTTLSGLNEIDIMCNYSFTSMDSVRRTSPSTITVSFHSSPEFIWIEAKAEDKDVKMIVNCSDQTATMTTPTFPTSASIQSTLSSITKTTSEYLTSSSPAVPTTVTTADSKETDTMAVHGISSNDFPIVAVIIPVVVLAGVGVGIFVWLKWRQRRRSESKKPEAGRSQDPRNWPSHAIQNIAYDNTDQLLANGPVKTSDNYIVLDEENTYTYIDNADAHAGLGKNSDSEHFANLNCTNFSTSSKSEDSLFDKGNKKADTTLSAENDYTGTYDTTNTSYSYAVLESQMSNKGADKDDMPNIEHETENVENHNYFVLEPQTARAVEYKNGGNPTEQSTDDRSEAHNYFVLEPQNPVGANQTFPQTIKTLQVETTDMEAAQSHDYFVLEPQKPPVETSIPPKTTATRAGGSTETEKAKHQNYHALEPQDTYSSIDPDDVVIQTLPENEYNMINMKGKATISRDPNYGTLETVDQIGHGIEDSSDYSHI